MQPVSIIAFYFIIWWMVLFVVLPWGTTSAHELDDDVETGNARSAPLKPRMALKLLATSLLAGVVLAIIYLVAVNDLFSLYEIPFFPQFPSITD